ncbi:MAG TPA: phosphoribosylglycinamide formyltransferase [Ktedonobacteraceae bacterium]|nr:phosphoribosylglycinamide formyltransferase [Ktedonobacteraceae bacterium]
MNPDETFEWKVAERRQKRSEGASPLRLGVLISGSGTNLQAMIDAIEGNELPGVEIALVASNAIDAYGLERAHRHNLQTLYLHWKNREESEATLITWLNLFQVDLVVLAGWMRILSAHFLAQFPNRVINIHPALIPDDGTSSTYTTQNGSVIPVFRGLHAVRQALDAGVTVTGSSVHFVTPEVDAGPVICREEVAILPGDTEESLHERLKAVEHRLVVQAIQDFASQFFPRTIL